MVLRRWGVLQDNLVLSTELTMLIGHRKEIRKLTFRALALRSAFKSLNGGQFTTIIQLLAIIILLSKTQLSIKTID